MANIILQPWGETPGEKSLRQKGHKTTQSAIIETGVTERAIILRKANAPKLMQKVGAALQKICELMADQGWDDDKVILTIGIQVRNNWELDCDNQPVEIGSNAWLDGIARQKK